MKSVKPQSCAFPIFANLFLSISQWEKCLIFGHYLGKELTFGLVYPYKMSIKLATNAPIARVSMHNLSNQPNLKSLFKYLMFKIIRQN